MKKNGTKKCNFNKKIDCRSPYGTWRCKKCNLVFSTRAQLVKHKHQFHPYVVWNKGLTKETSTSIAKGIQTLQKHIEDGSYVPQSHLHSKETREHLSEIRSTQLDSSKAGFQDVKWYKIKNINNEEYTVRGHWEENVAKRLNELNVLWIKNKWLKYEKDGIKRTYNPDFYLPATNEYIEVKGYYSSKDREKMRLVLEFNKNIRIFFIDQTRYNDFISGKTLLDDSLLISDKNL